MNGTIIQHGLDWVVSSGSQMLFPVHPDSRNLCKSGLHVDFDVQTIATGSGEFDVMDIDVAVINSTQKVQHGIAITRPWSSAMYEHNDRVREEVLANLRAKLDLIFISGTNDPEDTCYENEDLYVFAKTIVGSGWFGFSHEGIYDDCKRALDNLDGNWWLNEVYPELVSMGYVPNVYPFFIGY